MRFHKQDRECHVTLRCAQDDSAGFGRFISSSRPYKTQLLAIQT
jgi:hypothetical protein